ncbi:carbohydrate ABC transporter membrane protein 2, CUT1 family (TC 3.A.1.1.-) [Palleronia marisminoris]|uniref:sn-glycerol-3-phosphate transport system permease protein UgpE n=2 Tax=Palleronia marisminoris TaxID=315423 RepID=A0A1Y5S3W9_9RHOB|nr:carbohydrate ABC transporter membrane protein 2, CUT1 family (TC 3.A.1.1.-) [Palleronia marisminoris]SLN32083.1 L-arabinose transport system permease protein AraQ [Palleronia marisminoris]
MNTVDTTRARRGRMGRIGTAAGVHAVLLTYTLIAIFPVVIVVLNSFKNRRGIFTEPLALPTAETFSTEGYATVLNQGNFLLYYGNSLIVTIVSLFLILLCGAMAAHALSEYRFKLNTLLGVYLILGIMVPIRLGTVAILQLMVDLSLVNTLVSLILVYTAQGLPVAIFILTEFMRTLSRDIKDCARVDGLSEYRIFFEVVLPLIRPVLATVAVFSMIPIWNDLWFPLILASSDATKTVTLGVQQFIGQYTVNWSAVLASLSIAILPVLVLYAIFSRQLISGITAGAVKG